MQLPELQKQNEEVNRAYKYLEEQRKLLQEIRDYNTRYYMELWRRSESPGPNISRELKGMFGNHC
jgi:hypothetical protein